MRKRLPDPFFPLPPPPTEREETDGTDPEEGEGGRFGNCFCGTADSQSVLLNGRGG